MTTSVFSPERFITAAVETSELMRGEPEERAVALTHAARAVWMRADSDHVSRVQLLLSTEPSRDDDLLPVFARRKKKRKGQDC